MTARTPEAGDAAQRRTDGKWHRVAWAAGSLYYTDCDGEIRKLGGTRHTPGDTVRETVPEGAPRCRRCWR